MHKIRKFRALVLLPAVSLGLAILFSVLSATKEAQTRPGSDFRSAIEQGRATIKALQEESGIPGLSVAIGIDGKIVWSEGFGLADMENKVPVTNRTKFRIGSVSKMLTVAAVMRLHQEGKLDLDAPLQKYLPAIPEKFSRVTPRQLTGHLGGIRHYLAKDYAERSIDFQHFNSVEESLKIFIDDPPVAPPGEKYHYTTFGYTLLSRVVEAASGQDFLTYMQNQVFKPLGLDNTAADLPRQIIEHRSGFYERTREGRLGNAAYVDSSYKWAGGGILSTAEDLVRFGSAHLRPGYFAADNLELMFTPQKTNDGQPTRVGIGWRVMKDDHGRRIHHHAGSINGGRAVVVIYPDQGLVVSLLSNLGNTPPNIENVAGSLAEPFLNNQ